MVQKTLILHDGEYKKWIEKKEEYNNVYSPLTSNTTPSPLEASASDFFAPTTNTYSAFRAFDGDSTTAWLSLNENSTGFLSLRLAESKKLIAYEIISDNDSQIPKDWKLSGSDNGTTWDTIDTRSNLILPINTSNMFTIAPSKSYLYYKIEVTATKTANRRIRINTLNLYEAVDNDSTSWTTISSVLPTQEQFLSEGMDSLTPLLDRKVMRLEPQVMIQDSTSVGEGKMYRKKVDLNKYFDIRTITTETRNS